jgi:putative addiction module component (TIGR02574 family)
MRIVFVASGDAHCLEHGRDVEVDASAAVEEIAVAIRLNVSTYPSLPAGRGGPGKRVAEKVRRAARHRLRYTNAVAVLASVLEQALQLSDDERGELIARLVLSFEADDGEEIHGTEWEAAWSEELDRRLDDIREGRVQLVDRDEARARVRAAIIRSR